MKKLLILTLSIMMVLSFAACGGDTPPADTGSDVPQVSDDTPPADSEELTYTLDYETIAEWVDAGFIGIDESGAPIVKAIDAANETAIIIFGDNSDMTAASFVGAVTYDETTGTITDEANESTLTFGITEISEDTLELDMGDIGKATIKAAAKEEVLAAIKNAIDNYKHIV